MRICLALQIDTVSVCFKKCLCQTLYKATLKLIRDRVLDEKLQ